MPLRPVLEQRGKLVARQLRVAGQGEGIGHRERQSVACQRVDEAAARARPNHARTSERRPVGCEIASGNNRQHAGFAAEPIAVPAHRRTIAVDARLQRRAIERRFVGVIGVLDEQLVRA